MLSENNNAKGTDVAHCVWQHMKCQVHLKESLCAETHIDETEPFLKTFFSFFVFSLFSVLSLHVFYDLSIFLVILCCYLLFNPN